MNLTYIRLESWRQLKNARSMVFSLAVPIVMLFAFGGAYGGSGAVDPSTGLPWLVVLTIQMSAYGAMVAALGQSFSIVTERSIGWNRQLRVTPLTGTGYLVSKVIAAMAVAAMSIVVIDAISVIALRTPLPPLGWLFAGLAIWCGVIPFALIAIVIGQVAKPEFGQPLFTVVFMGLSLLGGLWVPLQIFPAWVSGVGRAVPSYWLNRLGQMGAHQSGDILSPALVLAAWTVALAAFIVWRYRRDAARA
ncbi:ABC transporter permease [Leifsonia sp. AG29]|uniref:ABC transporter permease n=1 Tax=Leifsonia sp. AG29 TaxID=2598860 RepID=UPI00131E0D90|nr:ABC transporter permease [Leifsonia sp. AG29]